MKKSLLTTAIILFSAAMFICCTPKSPVEKMKELGDKIELNQETYTNDDWAKVEEKFESLIEEFEKEKRTQEDIENFKEQRRRVKGYITQKDMKDLGKEIDDLIEEGIGIGKGIIDSVFE